MGQGYSRDTFLKEKHHTSTKPRKEETNNTFAEISGGRPTA